MLSKTETTSLMINLICAKLLLSYPRKIIQIGATAAWLEMIYVSLLCLGIFYLTVRVYKRKKSVIDLSFVMFGKTGQIIVGVICFVVLGINFVSVTRIYSESVKIVLLQNTDVNLILSLFMLTGAIGAYFGLKSTAKITYIVLPAAAIVFAAFLLLLIPEYNSQNIAPIFGTGAKNIFIGGINSSFVFSDILALNLLLSKTKSVEAAAKSGIKAIIISAVAGTLICFTYCLIFPYPTSKDFIMPVYQLSRFINTSSFFNRFEAFFQFTWSVLIILYCSAYVYILSMTWQNAFRLSHTKPLIFPVALLLGAIALLSDSMMDFMETFEVLENYVWPVALFLPLVVGIVYRLKKKSKFNL